MIDSKEPIDLIKLAKEAASLGDYPVGCGLLKELEYIERKELLFSKIPKLARAFLLLLELVDCECGGCFCRFCHIKGDVKKILKETK